MRPCYGNPLKGVPVTGFSCPNVPVPTWSWARWLFSEGCVWKDRDLKYTTPLHQLNNKFTKSPLYLILGPENETILVRTWSSNKTKPEEQDIRLLPEVRECVEKV